ncbi:MAG: hypothetical protein ACJ741_18325 [Pyrinomonadaceae bacterium]
MRVEAKNLKELLLAEAKAVDEAAQRAAEHALLVHKREGCPVSSWKDGRLVITPPEKIRVEEPSPKKRA